MLTLATEGRRPRPHGATLRDRARLGGARRASPASPCCARSTRSRCSSRSPSACAATLVVRRRAPRRAPRPAPRWARAGDRPVAGALTTSTTRAGPPLLLYLLGRGATPVARARHADRLLPRAERDRRGRARRDRHARRGAGRRRWSPCSSRSSLVAHLAGRPLFARLARARRLRARAHRGAASSRSPPGWSPRVALSAWTRLRARHGPGARRPADRGGRVLPGAGGRDTSHMHVGAVLIFEGPPPAYEDFVNQVRGRLHLVPRYRQKLAVPPLETGRPLWVDDPNFNLEYHVRHTALPAPGSEEQLRALAARIHSQQLDRSKPLWETWLVQGLEDDRFALISKTHHALVDGIAGVDLATVLFDLEPVPQPSAARGRAVGAAARAERGSSWPRAGVRGLVRAPFELAGRARRRGDAPERRRSRPRARRSRASARSSGPALNPAPDDAAQRADRPAPAARVRAQRAGRLQARQGRVRRHGQRRRADRRGRRAAALAALARRAHRGARAARARAGLDPRRATSTTSSATGSP